jgi:hypothetical protein
VLQPPNPVRLGYNLVYFVATSLQYSEKHFSDLSILFSTIPFKRIPEGEGKGDVGGSSPLLQKRDRSEKLVWHGKSGGESSPGLGSRSPVCHSECPWCMISISASTEKLFSLALKSSQRAIGTTLSLSFCRGRWKEVPRGVGAGEVKLRT